MKIFIAVIILWIAIDVINCIKIRKKQREDKK